MNNIRMVSDKKMASDIKENIKYSMKNDRKEDILTNRSDCNVTDEVSHKTAPKT